MPDSTPAVAVPVEPSVRPDAERAAFERWYSDGGKWPQSVERNSSGEGYKYVGAASAWTTWKAARTDLVAALQWYADGLHFDKASPDAWDTVSGEPQNWLCSGREDSATMVENGRVAKFALEGTPCNWIDGDEDNTPQPLASEVTCAA